MLRSWRNGGKCKKSEDEITKLVCMQEEIAEREAESSMARLRERAHPSVVCRAVLAASVLELPEHNVRAHVLVPAVYTV